MPFATTWMDLEPVILSEVNQAEKDKYHDIAYTQNPKKEIQINLFTKQKQSHRCRKQIYRYQRDWRGRDKLGDWDYTHTHYYVYDVPITGNQ